jgi:hypothetical protein
MKQNLIMKQKLYRIHFLAILTLLFSSCAIFIPGYSDYASAKRYYSIRNYDSAVFSVSHSLRIKPNNPTGISLLESAFPLAVHYHQSKVDDLKLMEDKSKWPKLVKEYEALQKLATEVQLLTPILQTGANYTLALNVKDYAYALKEAKPLAADYHYTLGLNYREEASKDDQKSAAINFKLALQYVQNYMNAQEFYEEAKANATFILLISSFKGDRNITEYLRDQMMIQQSNDSKEFLKIITREQLSVILNEQGLVQAGITENNYMEIGKLSGADHILSATIATTYRPVEIIKNEISQEREVTVRKESYVDSAGVKRTKNIKGKVKAKVKHFKKSTGATFNLSYQIMDVNSGEMVFYGTVKKRENFIHEWATFKGDNRALSDYYKRLVKRQDTFAPSKGDLYMKMARAVPRQFHNKIYQHYSD